MRALTMQLPFGGLIAEGTKTVETRSWSTKYRGPLAIHNGKSWPTGLRRFVRQWTGWDDDDLRDEIAAVFGRVDYDNCPGDLYEDTNGGGYWSLEPWRGREWTPGAVVAVADLADCLPMVEPVPICDYPPEPDRVIQCGPGDRVSIVDRDGPYAGEVVRDLAPERGCGVFEPGRYGWVLTNIRRLVAPVPATGRLGLWNVPDDIAAAVENTETITVSEEAS